MGKATGAPTWMRDLGQCGVNQACASGGGLLEVLQYKTSVNHDRNSTGTPHQRAREFWDCVSVCL